jgi:hypothetical protein
MQVWPTPSSADNHAKHIRQVISRHVTPSRRVLGCQKSAWPYSCRDDQGLLSGIMIIRVLRLATENPRWGYQRIQGELLKLGYRASASAILRVLKTLRIPPAPKRRTDMTWRQFLHSRAARMLAIDFFHVDCCRGCR